MKKNTKYHPTTLLEQIENVTKKRRYQAAALSIGATSSMTMMSVGLGDRTSLTAWTLSCRRLLKSKRVVNDWDKKDHVAFAKSEATLETLRSFDWSQNENDRRPWLMWARWCGSCEYLIVFPLSQFLSVFFFCVSVVLFLLRVIVAARRGPLGGPKAAVSNYFMASSECDMYRPFLDVTDVGQISCWFCLLIGCVVSATMTFGHRPISGSAPTLANPGNSFGTAGSRVVESSERDCAMLDDSDDDDWPDGGYSCSRDGGQAVDQQLSGAEISTDVVSSAQLGGVQLYVVFIMLRSGIDWNRIANAS